jgi:hypothetical protein
MTSSDVWVLAAGVSDQTDRYTDSLRFLNKAIDLDGFLSRHAQNLLSSAYKGLTRPRRDAIRIIDGLLDKDIVKLMPEKVAVLTQFRSQLMAELDDYCTELITLIDSRLLPSATDTRSQLFCEKLKGDYYRYSIECKSEADRVEVSEKANASYEKALTIARDGLRRDHPDYLGLAVSYSIFLYEIVGKKQEGIDFADQSYNDAGVQRGLCSDYDWEYLMLSGRLSDNVTMWRDEVGA